MQEASKIQARAVNIEKSCCNFYDSWGQNWEEAMFLVHLLRYELTFLKVILKGNKSVQKITV